MTTSRNSRTHRSRTDEDVRNQLSLDLDVKRVVPNIHRGNNSNDQDEIVPSLGLHMLQTGGNGGNDNSGTKTSSQKRESPALSSSDGEKNKNDGEEYLGDIYDDTVTGQDVKPQPPRRRIKTFVVIVLLLLQGILVYSLYTNAPSISLSYDRVPQTQRPPDYDFTKEAGSTTSVSLGIELRNGLALIKKKLSSLAASFTTKTDLPLNQLQKRLLLGQSLLNELNDPLGAHAACSSVANAIVDYCGEDTRTALSLSFASLTEVENRLYADSLLCIGNSKLALFSPTALSIQDRMAQLNDAKDALEAAASVDPINTEIRASLGLVFLLLGFVYISGDGSIHYLVLSVQHFNVAVARSEEGDAINLAAIHNLGLAQLALDSLRSGEESQFLNLVPLLQTPSLVLMLNEGAMLLQMGKADDAFSRLESSSQFLICAEKSSCERRNEMCSIVKHNQATAHHLINGVPVIADESGESDSLDDVAVMESLEKFATGKSGLIEESSHDNEEMKSSAGVIETHTKEDTHPSEIAKPSELQNALQALESAAYEGVQRPRVLLALAKARASMGNLSGAIDATITAINQATLAEEMETLTSYLEVLMSKLAEESNYAEPKHEPKQSFDQDKISRKRDQIVSELEMTLEIERLKYRVLEQEHALKYQEMRFTGGQNQIDYGSIRRTIDYPPETTSSEAISDKLIPNMRRNDELFDQRDTKDSFVDLPVNVEYTEVAESTEPHELDQGQQTVNTAQETTMESNDKERETGTSDNATDEGAAVAANELREDEAVDASEMNTTATATEPISLPELFSPTLQAPTDLTATAKSYMKIADAYLDKGKYSLASKQFLKVIRKTPDHLAAHLGYATALERAGKNKQVNDAAAAYGNATRVAVIQGDKVDPFGKAGTGGIGESILRRALQIAQSASTGRLELLRTLSTYAHTAALAADLYYAIGIELTNHDMDQESIRDDALTAFTIANEFAAMRNDTDIPCHVQSIIEIGKLASDQGNSITAIEYLERLKSLQLEDDVHVKLLVLSGKAHSAMGEVGTAIADLTRALSFPQCDSTASAHHELALVLSKNNGEIHEINSHFEQALDLGMDPTTEAIASLGEHNMSIIRSYNRQHWRKMNNGHQESTGGIMSGGAIGSQKSVFAPKAGNEDLPSENTDTLSLLEQGASSYDGHAPMGGENDGDVASNLSNLNGRKRTPKS